MLWIIAAIENEEDRTFVEEIYLKYEKNTKTMVIEEYGANLRTEISLLIRRK